MKVSKALRNVMVRWELTNYQLSKESGVDRTAIGRILDGKAEGTTWINVEKIAMGLEKIDPIAKIAFLGTLALPDDALGDDFLMLLAKQKKQVKEISKVLVALDKRNFLNRGIIDGFKAALQKAGSQMTFEEFIYGEARSVSPRDIPEAEMIKPSADDLV
jgi:hypothetical protein